MAEARRDFARDFRRRFRGYSGGRPDVLRLIPAIPSKVLDIGCGAGLLGSQLSQKYPECLIVGVEPDAERAALARERFDQVITGSIDDDRVLDLLRRLGPFDLIVCADVLEHLIAPESSLQALSRLLSPDGYLITSLPNIRHISTFVGLYLLGRWPQRSRGIHDRTHLHFYARPNILELGHAAGLYACDERRNLRLFEAHSWSMVPAKLLDFWPFRGIFTFQYLHLWRREG